MQQCDSRIGHSGEGDQREPVTMILNKQEEAGENPSFGPEDIGFLRLLCDLVISLNVQRAEHHKTDRKDDESNCFPLLLQH